MMPYYAALMHETTKLESCSNLLRVQEVF